MRRRLVLWLGNSLIAAGLLLLAGTAALYGYSLYEEDQASREAAALAPAVPGAWTPVSTPSAIPTPTTPPTATPVPFERGGPTEGTVRVEPTSTPTPVPTSTPVPILPAERITAPAIGLDSKVVESPIVNGQWVVPKFVAGHLVGTAQPLEGGNVVLSGHVQSISSGNVFAHIDQLHPGDVVRLYTRQAVITYIVAQIRVVANNDMSVVQPTPVETLTLITCTGTWLPLQHDYNQRTVVIAQRV